MADPSDDFTPLQQAVLDAIRVQLDCGVTLSGTALDLMAAQRGVGVVTFWNEYNRAKDFFDPFLKDKWRSAIETQKR